MERAELVELFERTAAELRKGGGSPACAAAVRAVFGLCASGPRGPRAVLITEEVLDLLAAAMGELHGLTRPAETHSNITPRAPLPRPQSVSVSEAAANVDAVRFSDEIPARSNVAPREPVSLITPEQARAERKRAAAEILGVEEVAPGAGPPDDGDGDALGPMPQSGMTIRPTRVGGARDPYSKAEGAFGLTPDGYSAKYNEEVNPDWTGGAK